MRADFFSSFEFDFHDFRWGFSPFLYFAEKVAKKVSGILYKNVMKIMNY